MNKFQSIQQLNKHKDWVRCIVELSDGRFISGSVDSSIMIWNNKNLNENNNNSYQFESTYIKLMSLYIQL